jgi:hypothetical protein
MSPCEHCGHVFEAHTTSGCQATIYSYPTPHQLDYTYPCACKQAPPKVEQKVSATAVNGGGDTETPRRRGRPPGKKQATVSSSRPLKKT